MKLSTANLAVLSMLVSAFCRGMMPVFPSPQQLNPQFLEFETFDPTENILMTLSAFQINPGSEGFDVAVEELLQESDNREMYSLCFAQIPPVILHNQLLFLNYISEQGLKDNYLLMALIIPLRGRDLDLFQQMLSIGHDNFKIAMSGPLFQQLLFELACPLTPPEYLKTFLDGRCFPGLAQELFKYMTALNPQHHAVFAEQCQDHLTHQMCLQLIGVEPQEKVEAAWEARQQHAFIKSINLGNVEGEAPAIGKMQKVSLAQFEVVYSIASTTLNTIPIREGMGPKEMLHTFELHALAEKVPLAGAILNKATDEMTLFKTAGRAPFFGLFTMDDGQCSLVSGVDSIFAFANNRDAEFLTVTVDIDPSQFLIGAPFALVQPRALPFEMEFSMVIYDAPDSPDVLLDAIRGFVTKGIEGEAVAALMSDAPKMAVEGVELEQGAEEIDQLV